MVASFFIVGPTRSDPPTSGGKRLQAQLSQWLVDGWILGIYCAGSGFLGVEVDLKNDPEAWAFFSKWMTDAGFSAFDKPLQYSRSGAPHYAFRTPDGWEPEKHGGTKSFKISHFRALKPDEKDREIFSIRNRGLLIAAGMVVDGKKYQIAADPVIHPWLPALGDVLSSVTPLEAALAVDDGTRIDKWDVEQTRALYEWLSNNDVLTTDEMYRDAGMVARAEFTEATGRDLFLIICHDDYIPESRWRSFDVKSGPGSVKMETLFKLAKAAGWTGSVRKSAAALFEGVAAMVEQLKNGTYVAPAYTPRTDLPPPPPPGPGTAHGWGDEDEASLLGPLPEHPDLTAPQANMLARFWAHVPSGKIIYEGTREMWVSGSFDKHVGRVKDAMKTEGPGMLASTWLSQHRYVQSMGWAPGEPIIVENKVLTKDGWSHSPGDKTFNMYVPPDIKHVEGDVSKWLDHIRFIYPNEAEHIVYWLAHRVQRPSEKVNHCLDFIGPQGIGKDTIITPAITAIGLQNFKQISAKVFYNSEWNDYLQSIILRINEIHDLGGESRYSFYDGTKDAITNPPETHRINTKHVPQYSAVNVCGVIMTSNHLDALYIPSGDRRHYVCVSNRTKEDFPAEYFDDIYSWFKNGGNEAVAHYLANLDLSAFNAMAPPPNTAGWHRVVAAGLAPESSDLSDIIEAMGKPAALTLSMIRVKTPGDSALRLLFEDVKLRKTIPKRLAEAGYVAVPNPDAHKSGGRWRMPGGKVAIYARQELSESEQLAAARNLVVPPLPY